MKFETQFERINVTKAYLPKRKELDLLIDSIYESSWLTNLGPCVRQLESKLQDRFQVKHVISVANGSVALQVLYKAMGLKGSVVTTPFSFVATTSTLVWEGLKPIFSDIDSKSFNLDPSQVEKKIESDTSAILGVHVYGNPCDVKKLNLIAEDKNLKLIYDAAHAFDVSVGQESIFKFGHASTVSFHATKIFHTIEGGAIFTDDDELATRVRMLINFGITGPTTIESVGTNMKMNEFEAAMGLAILGDMDLIHQKRDILLNRYRESFLPVLETQSWHQDSHRTAAYAPFLFESEESLLRVQRKLESLNVYTRRYFYPSLDTLAYLNIRADSVCPISYGVSKRILCFPLYADLSEMDQVTRIIQPTLEALL